MFHEFQPEAPEKVVIERFCKGCIDQSLFTNIQRKHWNRWLRGSKSFSSCETQERMYCIKCGMYADA